MLRTIAAAILVAIAACTPRPAPSASAAAFSFALLGDAPYSTADEDRFAAMLEQINDDASLRFVLHVGDIKGSAEPCSDALLRRRLAQFDAVRTALVYTPGDNEWTDCHRRSAGGFHPLDRLAVLRRLAFPNPNRSFGQRPLALQSQADAGPYREFAENTLFTYQGVVFVTLHVVGSKNDLEPWFGIDRSDRADAPRADRLAAFRRREAANLAWLKIAFSSAESAGAIALVVLMQANPRFELDAGDPRRAGFDPVIDELRRLTLRFGRPVLLAHGDQHVYLVDQPLTQAQPPLTNLWRVQTYGHPWPHWVRVSVDPRRADVFSFRSGPPAAKQ